MRTCRACGEPKSDEELRKDGQCKPCYNAYQRAWYQANREQITEKWRAQRAANPDAVRARERAYWDTRRDQKRAKDARHRAKDPEKNRQRARAWAEANPERVQERNRRKYLERRDERIARQREYAARQDPEVVREKRRAYYQRNRERILEQAKVRRAADPQRANSGSRRRRAQKRAIGTLLGFHTEAEWQAKLAEFGGRCAHCGTDQNITRDHIIPLSKGGPDTIDNIQPLCYPCNSRKSARMMEQGGK